MLQLMGSAVAHCASATACASWPSPPTGQCLPANPFCLLQPGGELVTLQYPINDRLDPKSGPPFPGACARPPGYLPSRSGKFAFKGNMGKWHLSDRSPPPSSGRERLAGSLLAGPLSAGAKGMCCSPSQPHPTSHLLAPPLQSRPSSTSTARARPLTKPALR